MVKCFELRKWMNIVRIQKGHFACSLEDGLGHEDIRERMDCSEYQLNGDTSYSGKFSVFHFPVFLFSI